MPFSCSGVRLFAALFPKQPPGYYETNSTNHLFAKLTRDTRQVNVVFLLVVSLPSCLKASPGHSYPTHIAAFISRNTRRIYPLNKLIAIVFFPLSARVAMETE